MLALLERARTDESLADVCSGFGARCISLHPGKRRRSWPPDAGWHAPRRDNVMATLVKRCNIASKDSLVHGLAGQD